MDDAIAFYQQSGRDRRLCRRLDDRPGPGRSPGDPWPAVPYVEVVVAGSAAALFKPFRPTST